ncbi:MAG: hypothetical protein EPO35_08850 [Acidobacteria bacterium]|nr:MAG: hypothetical protein EPO35_08850 [Acidobacteriota bacterium]
MSGASGQADHAGAMRRKRRTVFVLVVAVALIGVAIYREWLGWWGIPIGWLTILAGVIVGNRVLSCPSCHARLGGLFQTACANCGVLLTDAVMILPAQQGPIDPAAAEYMAKSRRILAAWSRVRRVLRWLPYVAGLAVTIGMAVGLDGSSWGERLGLGAFVGAAAAAVAWLILVHIVDNAFGIGFMAFRGRCPVCRAWFTPPSSFGPASIAVDYSLPKFCGSCGAKLG